MQLDGERENSLGMNFLLGQRGRGRRSQGCFELQLPNNVMKPKPLLSLGKDLANVA